MERRWAIDELKARVVRYRDLKPCFNAFIDTRSPGSEAKENFTIIGPGVSENPEQHVHIAEPHGFNVGGARQPPGCVNSQHSHDTAESFIAHTGTWRFDLGEHGEDAQVILKPGDVISIPTKTFRGFTNISEGSEPEFLFGLLGQDDPGRVTWARKVFDMASDYGLVLLEDGSLIDKKRGQAVPEGKMTMAPTSAEQVAALTRFSQADANALVVHGEDAPTRIIGEGGPLGWEHGYTLDRYEVAGAARFDPRGAVLFVHEGSASLRTGDGEVALGTGDTMSVPAALDEAVLSGERATVFAVRRA